jgi:glycine oxidase
MLAPLAESPDPGPFSRLAIQGLKAFEALAADVIGESGIDFEFRRDGVLRVAESEDEAGHLHSIVRLQERAEWLDGPALRSLEPGIADQICGALYSPAEGHINPTRLTSALATAASRRGARVLEGQEIRTLTVQGSRVVSASGIGGTFAADHFVLAGGAWISPLANSIGVSVPIEPVRGQMLAVHQTPPPIRHIIYSQDGYLVPKPDGSVWVGATEEHDAGFDAAVTVSGLHSLVNTAERLVPDLGAASYIRSWAGLRPCAPDRLPILGTAPTVENLHLAAGHFRNGILLSLITGRLITQLIVTGSMPPEFAAFSPGRFTD